MQSIGVNQLVDVPNMLVSAFLPEDIFTGQVSKGKGGSFWTTMQRR